MVLIVPIFYTGVINGRHRDDAAEVYDPIPAINSLCAAM